MIGLVGVRHPVPAQSEVQSEPVGGAPVVLNVGAVGDVIPLTGDLHRILGIILGVAEQEVGKVIARVEAVEAEVTLGVGEGVLPLAVKRPAKPKLQLMRALGPGNVIADLVIVRFVIPRRPVGGVVGSRAATEINRRNAGVHVRSRKQPVEGEGGGSCDDAVRNDMDAVAVVVESNLVEQGGTDHVRGMHDGAIGGISENIADRGDVIAAPLSGSVGLRDLLGNPVTEDRELVTEGVIDAGNLFPHGGGRIGAARKLRLSRSISAVVGREDTCGQQRLRVRVQQVGRNRVAREGRSRNQAVSGEPGQLRGRQLGSRRNLDEGGAQISAVGAGRRNDLMGGTAVYQAAPFHVVEEERLRIVAVFELYRAAHVEAVGVEAQLFHGLRCGVEVVAGIERVVAIELPTRGMELFSSGLDNLGDGCGRGETVLGAVVRGHVAEFGDGVERGHDAAAAAAAIEVFAAVNELKVVASALAVDADVAVAADRGRDDEVALDARCSGGQGEQGVDATPVGGELGHLVACDDVANLAGVRLHPDGIRFDGDGFFGGAQGQGKVQAGAIADVQYHAGLLCDLEPGSFSLEIVMTDRKIGGDILASVVADNAVTDTGVRVGNGNGDVGDDRSRRIRHGSHDGGLLAERERRANHENA